MKSISGRREFLKHGAGLVGLAAGTVGLAKGDDEENRTPFLNLGYRPVGGPSHYEKLRRTGNARYEYTPLQNLQGIITPSNLHFVVNHEEGLLVDIDPLQHRLIVFGLVEHPLVLTMAELKRLPCVSRIRFLECNGNATYRTLEKKKTAQETHGLTSCSEWTGVLLSTVLREVGIKKGATWIVAIAADPSKHAVSIPMEKVMDDVMLAYNQNGEPLQLDQGYPLRLVVPGWGGRMHVKWLESIKVVDQPYMTNQDRSAHTDHDRAGEGTFLLPSSGKAINWRFEAFPKSVITFPSGGQQLSDKGFYEITGLAWSGAGSVRRVEVSTDGGRTWNDAHLQEPVIPKAHTRFRFPWTWKGDEVVLQSRCTDDQGDRQPSGTELSKNWGSDPSKACTSVLGDVCKQVPRRADTSYIQSWRVAPDGKVSNAFVLTPEMVKIEAEHKAIFVGMMDH